MKWFERAFWISVVLITLFFEQRAVKHAKINRMAAEWFKAEYEHDYTKLSAIERSDEYKAYLAEYKK